MKNKKLTMFLLLFLAIGGATPAQAMSWRKAYHMARFVEISINITVALCALKILYMINTMLEGPKNTPATNAPKPHPTFEDICGDDEKEEE
jgi:hypothetical protein